MLERTYVGAPFLPDMFWRKMSQVCVGHWIQGQVIFVKDMELFSTIEIKFRYTSPLSTRVICAKPMGFQTRELSKN